MFQVDKKVVHVVFWRQVFFDFLLLLLVVDADLRVDKEIRSVV